MSSEQFHKLTSGNPPRELAKKVLPFLNNDSLILDCGCGAGNDTFLFISQGHRVIALDNETSIINDRTKGLINIKEKVKITEIDISNFKVPKIDCFYSSLTLSFLPKKDFYDLWSNIITKLERGTIIAINIFGDRDDWYENTEDRTFMKEEEFKNLISNFEILYFKENEKLGTCMGKDGFPTDKKWHIFECIIKI